MKSRSTSITHTPTENLLVPARKMAGQKRFGMLPADVMANPRISLGAKVIFAAMAMESYSSGECKISNQAIATLIGAARMTVSNAIAQLQMEGLIEPIGEPVKQIQHYRLLHPKFAVSLGSSVEAAADPLLHNCAKCGQLRRVNKACVCYSCVRKMNAAAKIAQQITEIKGSIERLTA